MKREPPSYTPRGLAVRMNRAYFWERAARGLQNTMHLASEFDLEASRVLRHAEDRARRRGDLLAWLYVSAAEGKAGRPVLT